MAGENSRQQAVEEAIKSLFKRKDLGFLNTQALMSSIDECKQNLSFFEDKSRIVVIGLGGSSLGTKALCDVLWPHDWRNKVTFFDNIDGSEIDHFLDGVDDPKSLGWILCSKSGGTIEVTALYDYCFEYINKFHDFSIVANTVCITEKKSSPIYNFAKANNCPVLSVPLNIGGRFSVFTNIGVFPLSYLGVNCEKLLEGYQLALSDKEGLQAMVCQLWASFERGDNSFYSFQYCESLSQWGLWLQQLWSESLSKKENFRGEPARPLPTFVPCRGVSDQHSVLQQVIEGQESKLACVHLVESSAKSKVKIQNSHFEKSLMRGRSVGDLFMVEAEATVKAISEAGIPTMVLKTDRLDEKSMAHLMGLWMLSVGVLGELADIDAFNQPGVESGKVIARRVLS